MLPILFLPAFVLAAPAPVVPDAIQVHPRVWVLKVAPTAATYAALKGAGITHVINLRRDGEPGFEMEAENNAMMAAEIVYIRLAMGRSPTTGDLDLFRSVLKDLPAKARVLVHCGNGNRAAAAVCGFLVVEEGMNPEKALVLAREAGLSAPETEKALQAYLAKGRS